MQSQQKYVAVRPEGAACMYTRVHPHVYGACMACMHRYMAVRPEGTAPHVHFRNIAAFSIAIMMAQVPAPSPYPRPQPWP